MKIFYKEFCVKNKLLKLAKRLNKFTLEEVEPILNCEKLQEILDELVKEKLLQFKNGIYSYIKNESKKSDLPLFFQFHTKDELDMIIKCFCTGITSDKVAFLLDVSDAT